MPPEGRDREGEVGVGRRAVEGVDVGREPEGDEEGPFGVAAVVGARARREPSKGGRARWGWEKGAGSVVE